MSSDPWGRVDETGTVYVRTADGEREVGSWQAGSPEEALAYFERKYEGLVVEIGLLERRVRTTDLAPKDALTAIDHLRVSVDGAHAVGDLEALTKRLDALVGLVESRREERKAAKAKQTDEAKHSKEALVAEAEQLAESEQWRSAGERLRALVDTWKGLPAWTARPTTSCGTASATPVRSSPSGARRTSPRWTPSGRTRGAPRRSWSTRRWPCPSPRTGDRPPRVTASS